MTGIHLKSGGINCNGNSGLFIQLYVTVSLRCTLQTNTTLQINSTSVKKKYLLNAFSILIGLLY